jgi:hypothetical protein
MDRLLVDREEIQMRAAEVRTRWSRRDHLQRWGLPPDLPSGLQERLREYQMLVGSAPRPRRYQLLLYGVSNN